ncbi:uncharacterized protein LOC135342047 [Halichondria panicea]|uniref:uncharacterized protein LOC135342047 n=1 Tax=Halichondria panicea TaxID=6063 RepID=UPI00312B685B
MGNVDSLPVISQTKSAVQAIAGDKEGAWETQINFLETFPVVSQGTSFYHWWQGNNEEAKRTQVKFAQGMSNLANGIPAVGHVKGTIHYALGDKEGGDTAMKAASRTVGVIGGGFVGELAGPVGGIAGGIAGGAAVDGMTTGIESAVHNEYRPSGQVAVITNIINGEANVGDIFDSTAHVFFDGWSGYGAGKAGARFRNRNNSQLYRVASEQEVQNTVKTGKLHLKGPHGEYWVSETMEHTEPYYESRPYSDKAVLKIEVPKEYINEIKAQAVDQRGYKTNVQALPDGKVPNMLNTERISQPGKVNIGIKGETNLKALNNQITSVERVYPGKNLAKIPAKLGQYGASAGVGIHGELEDSEQEDQLEDLSSTEHLKMN